MTLATLAFFTLVPQMLCVKFNVEPQSKSEQECNIGGSAVDDSASLMQFHVHHSDTYNQTPECNSCLTIHGFAKDNLHYDVECKRLQNSVCVDPCVKHFGREYIEDFFNNDCWDVCARCIRDLELDTSSKADWCRRFKEGGCFAVCKDHSDEMIVTTFQNISAYCGYANETASATASYRIMSDNEKYWNVGEIQLMKAGEVVPISMNTCSASSTSFNYPCESAFDGLTASGNLWSPDWNVESPPYWIQFVGSIDVDTLRLYQLDHAHAAASVQRSMDGGVTWSGKTSWSLNKVDGGWSELSLACESFTKEDTCPDYCIWKKGACQAVTTSAICGARSIQTDISFRALHRCDVVTVIGTTGNYANYNKSCYNARQCRYTYAGGQGTTCESQDCNFAQSTSITSGNLGAGTIVYCPAGQTKYGDGSACSGGGRPNCKTYGNPGLPLCSSMASEGVSACQQTPSPTPSPTQAASWVLTAANKYCSTINDKQVASSVESITQCQQLVQADSACGNTMYTNGANRCWCLFPGETCAMVVSYFGDNVYTLQQAPTPAPTAPTPATTIPTPAPTAPTRAPTAAIAKTNILAGIAAIATRCCSNAGCGAMTTNGNLNDRSLGSHCGNTQELIFDLGSTKSASKLTYVHCANPGFSNGAVNQFALYASDSISGPWNQVVTGDLPEDITNSMTGTNRDFDLLEGSSGRYWKWNALSNHGNGAYIWTCEIELYETLSYQLHEAAIGCGAQYKNLGNIATPELCAQQVVAHTGCGPQFMFGKYTSWGCRCCTVDGADGGKSNVNWNLYTATGWQPAACMWRQTGGCSPTGSREPNNDKACTDSIPVGNSGFCDCDGDGVLDSSELGYDCSSSPGRCNNVCLEANDEPYRMLFSGTCTEPVKTKGECDSAAKALGRPDTTSRLNTNVGSTRDPPYCHEENGELRFKDGAVGTCSAEQPCLCKTQAYTRLSAKCGNPTSISGDLALTVDACKEACNANINCNGFDSNGVYCYLKGNCNGIPGAGKGYRKNRQATGEKGSSSYKIGPRNSNDCPSGYSKLQSSAECRLACKSLGWPTDAHGDRSSQTGYPSGCIESGRYCYWNGASSGQASGQRSPVCLQAPTTPPAHDASKCLENNGRGLKIDPDCIDCSNPPRQGCADGYIMTQHVHDKDPSCKMITCVPPDANDEDLGSKSDRACITVGTTQVQCRGDSLMVNGVSISKGSEEKVIADSTQKLWTCGGTRSILEMPGKRTHLRVKWSIDGGISMKALDCPHQVDGAAQPFFLKNVQTGRCVHAEKATASAGSKLMYGDGCSGEKNVFIEKYEGVGDGSFFLQSLETNKCVQSEDVTANQGSHLVYGECTGIEPLLVKDDSGLGDGSFFIRNVKTGQCIHTEQSSARNGARLIFWEGCALAKNMFAKEYVVESPLQPASDPGVNLTSSNDSAPPERRSYEFVEGPRVSNDAYKSFCSNKSGSLAEAKKRCSNHPDCSVLHNVDCDGRTWRHCRTVVDDLQGVDSNACTKVVRPHETNTTDNSDNTTGTIDSLVAQGGSCIGFLCLAFFGVVLVAFICCRNIGDGERQPEKGAEAEEEEEAQEEEDTGSPDDKQMAEEENAEKLAGDVADKTTADNAEGNEYAEEEWAEEYGPATTATYFSFG